MCRMARLHPSLATASLLSMWATRSGSESLKRSLSTSLCKLAYRPLPGSDHFPSSSIRRQQGTGAKSTTRNVDPDSLMPTLTKRLNLNGQNADDRSINPGHTIFTSPGATKRAVVDSLDLLEMPDNRGHAVVIFASPRHASWLTDTAFMARLVTRLHKRRPYSYRNFHVLAAVVDGLCPKYPGREMRDGISIQFGSLDRLLPGLWDGASDETLQCQTPSGGPGVESAHVSVVLRRRAYNRETHTVTLPLANTLFHNGRRTTLLASEWQDDGSRDQGMILLRMTEKRVQKIDLPMLLSEETQTIHMRCPLVPITHLRQIVEGLGNILAKVDIGGVPSPASKELQVNVPRYLQQRQSRSDQDPQSARIGVWALIVPERLIVDDDEADESTPFGVSKERFLNFKSAVRAGQLGTAADKLAFEMTLASDRTAWQRTNVMGEILLQGGRLYKILSGGGEWGAKASLLSLDPQTTYGVESEDDELDRFQRAFHGEHAIDGATTQPGDYVQFFVEGDSEVAPQGQGLMKLLPTTSSLPHAAFGVGEFGKEDHTPEKVDASVRDQRELVKLGPNHFGAFSAEGLYLELRGNRVDKTTTTKVNAPGTMIHPVSSGAGKRVAPAHLATRKASRYMSL